MAPHRNDPDDSSEDSSGHPTGLLGQLRAIIEAFAEIETNEGGHRRESGRIERGGTSIEYDYDVSIGFGPGTQSDSPRPPDGTARDPGDDTPALHIETRDIDETECVVIADLPGATEAELDVTFDAERGVLELWIGAERVERVALDTRTVTITDVTLNNQILEVRLERTCDANDSESNDQ
ncbi:gas vesicle protein GvpH [Natronomonas sp. LN261]|uniref:gas vesicle protein GvpH n=1 Tax=Natronomonas sp. LN261 TaxID=2750669 RepID=UPI0015EF9529|nr:gas vesicle protein GvpH [Natronomonas sp. LN261]